MICYHTAENVTSCHHKNLYYLLFIYFLTSFQYFYWRWMCINMTLLCYCTTYNLIHWKVEFSLIYKTLNVSYVILRNGYCYRLYREIFYCNWKIQLSLYFWFIYNSINFKTPTFLSALIINAHLHKISIYNSICLLMSQIELITLQFGNKS